MAPKGKEGAIPGQIVPAVDLPIDGKGEARPDGKGEGTAAKGKGRGEGNQGKPDENLLPCLIIDNGSATIKAGLNQRDKPTAVFPCIVGCPEDESQSDVVGTTALQQRESLTLKFPIEQGLITDWPSVEKIWHHIFYNEVHVDPEKTPVLFTEAPMTPRANREKMTEIIFLSFNVPNMIIGIQAVLSMFASARCTGTLIDLGGGITDVVPIYEGYAMPHAIFRIEVGGNELNEFLIDKIEARGNISLTPEDKESIKKLKETHCYISQKFDEELAESFDSNDREMTWTLPSGKTISINSERFECPEIHFKPYLLGDQKKQFKGIHEAAHESVMKCEEDIHKDLIANVVLAGGGSMFPGLQDRLSTEIKSCDTTGAQPVRVLCPEERAYSAWCGGAILASLPPFRQMWCNREDFDEIGPVIIHRKYF